MRVALCYWGIARSTDETIESIERNILKPLLDANVDVRVYVHTYTSTQPYTNPRANEFNLQLKNDIWKLLLPDYYKVERQEDVDLHLQHSKYRKHGDPWAHEPRPLYTKYSTLDNCIRALWSLFQVTQLWLPSADQFDAVLYLRPDVRFVTPLKYEWLLSLQKGVIRVPNFHLVDGWNDRFAVGKPCDMRLYGLRFTAAYTYSQDFPLHSEKFLAAYMEKHSIKAEPIHIRFRRIRADGVVCPADEEI